MLCRLTEVYTLVNMVRVNTNQKNITPYAYAITCLLPYQQMLITVSTNANSWLVLNRIKIRENRKHRVPNRLLFYSARSNSIWALPSLNRKRGFVCHFLPSGNEPSYQIPPSSGRRARVWRFSGGTPKDRAWSARANHNTEPWAPQSLVRLYTGHRNGQTDAAPLVLT